LTLRHAFPLGSRVRKPQCFGRYGIRRKVLRAIFLDGIYEVRLLTPGLWCGVVANKRETE